MGRPGVAPNNLMSALFCSSASLLEQRLLINGLRNFGFRLAIVIEREHYHCRSRFV